VRKKIVLLSAVLAMVLAAAAPALGQSPLIPLDDGFVGAFEEGGVEGQVVFSGDTSADSFEAGNFSGASVGSGFGFEDPFAATEQFGGQGISVVGADGFVYLAGDFGVQIIDLSELEIPEEPVPDDGGAGEDQYDG